MHQKAILNTWKEIAQYVGRSVRTIQRWERDLGFPIHRPRGRQRSAVIAMPAEIDEWARRTPSADLSEQRAQVTVINTDKWKAEPLQADEAIGRRPPESVKTEKAQRRNGKLRAAR